MPNYTPNFDLPYPNSTDDPCLFAEQWCEFTAAIDAVFDGFQETVDRTVPLIPAAQLRATTARAYTVATGDLVFFDTVSFDTAGWIDFDADTQTIATDRGGVLATVGNVTQAPDGTNSIWNIVVDGIGGLGNNITDRGVVGQTVGNWTVEDEEVIFPTFLHLSVSGTQNTYTINTAYLTAFWHADTRRPA